MLADEGWLELKRRRGSVDFVSRPSSSTCPLHFVRRLLVETASGINLSSRRFTAT